MVRPLGGTEMPPTRSQHSGLPESSYWFHAETPRRGSLVEVRVGLYGGFPAQLEEVSADGSFLWTAASPALGRTLFFRQKGSSVWTSNGF